MTSPPRWRIAHWSPWGADASGITNYCEHLVPALGQHVDVTVVHPSEVDPVLRTRTPREATSVNLDPADLHVFHVGNNLAYHHWMLGPLLRHGGVLVLHDWGLFDMIRPLYYRSIHLWERELAYNGELDRKLQLHRNEPGFLMAHPLNRRYLEAADVVVTHSTWIRDHALELHPHLDVRYVPLAGPTLARSPVVRDAPFTVLGGIGRHKKIEWAIEAFAAVERAHPAARLRIVGRGDDRHEIKRLRELAERRRVAPRVEWHLDVDRATYLRLLAESLFVITLREETAGEMSGVMVEAWGAGRVAVTSDQPQFRGFDERFCRRVPVGPGAVDALAALMRDALAHPDAYDDAGRAGHEYIARECTFEHVAAQHAEVIDAVARRRRVEPLGGLNLVGSWGTPSGLGEVARRLADALLDDRLAVAMPPGFRLDDYDAALVPHRYADVPRDVRYGINLITANINELHVVDPGLLGGPHDRRWNIGLWIYEFPEIPPVLARRAAQVDEIWTGSGFAESIFRQYFDGPITRLHNVVRARAQSTPAALVRRAHGLREHAIVVLYSFDFKSGWARKNPLAVVAAFADAVAATGADAQLVLKASGLTPAYREVLERALARTDGVLIDAHLSDADLGDLFHAADVYCSLHRAEGFGLGLAEAMAIGKTAVATRYSGNLEFMDDDNSLLVECSMAEITAADAAANPGLERIVVMGARWAEPSHEAAVAALVRSFDPATRATLGARAARDMAERFDDRAAARIVRRRLGELADELGRFRTTWPRPLSA
jgi:glycosyltransferase involved in cell wall biosynthesis